MSVKNDPALRTPEQHERIAEAESKRDVVNAACTRRPVTAAEAVSIEALPEPGWFQRQVKSVTEEIRQWPESIRREAGLDQGHFQPSVNDIDSLASLTPQVVRNSTSIEAIVNLYPQVARIVAENDRLRDAAGSVATDLEARCVPTARLEAYTARFMVECAERLRAAVVGA